MKESSTALRIVDAAQYGVVPERISAHARLVVERLQDAGYTAYLVGGCVRDLVLGRVPKDFDVVTQAHPEEIRQIFRNARLIGRRFRLAHVHFGREIIEVATYRATPVIGDGIGDGNVFGTVEEDAYRRDFTVNALYYEPKEGVIRDYVNGLMDLQESRLRVIGDSEERFREDPVRMLRAARFAVKLGLNLTQSDLILVRRLGPLLADVAAARLFEEMLKLLHTGYARPTYTLLRQWGLFGVLFPEVESLLDPDIAIENLVTRALANSDKRIADNKPVTPAFLFAALLWEPVRVRAAHRITEGLPATEAWSQAAEQVLRMQLGIMTIPKRFSVPMREIWALQGRFDRRVGKHAFRFLENKRFRAAYDFFGLRAQGGEVEHALFDWWTLFQEVAPEERQAMVEALHDPKEKRGRKRKRRRATS